MSWLVGTAIALIGQQLSPDAVAARFLALLNEDPPAASALIEPGAIMSAGHIGGPLTVELMPIRRFGCVQHGDVRVRPEPVSDQIGEAFLVDTEWLCPLPNGRDGRPLNLMLAVRGQRIAGAYLIFAERTEPWTSR